MVRIVRVSPQQFEDLLMKLPPEKRWIMGGFTSANLYLAQANVLIVRKDEVEVRDLPLDEILSIVSACRCAYDMKEVA
jgi:hypothetical protein